MLHPRLGTPPSEGQTVQLIAFAARFRELVEQPPLGYAIQWRMSLAKDALRTTNCAIGELAFELGFESGSAFSTAFRREVGRPPRVYRYESRASPYMTVLDQQPVATTEDAPTS